MAEHEDERHALRMGESWKAVLAFIFIAGGLTALITWFDDQPNEAVWTTRIVSPVVAICALSLLLKLQFRRDREPDYLLRANGEYFNRGGFSFSFAPTAVGGVCWIEAYFQNQYDRPCVGRIALRPARGFFLGRADIQTIVWEIECEPAAFGLARVPIPLPRGIQGKKQGFEVGASVDYPEGAGARVRFRDGIFLRSSTNFGDAFGATVVLAGVLTGTIVMSKPANCTMHLPADVAEEVPALFHPEVVTLWRLGDLPLGMPKS